MDSDNKANSSTNDTEGGHGSEVASHYNNLKEVGIEARKESRIYHMRGFNNWVKSIIIGDFVDKIKSREPRKDIKVLDLGSGKGGDLKKMENWKDLASTSVQQSESRYKSMKEGENPRFPLFDAEFIAADCSKVRLRDMYKDRDVVLDMTSCQFAYHYSFESLEQADMMMRNACERLRPGGFFVGTIPDSRELVRRLKASEDLSFGSDVCRVKFESKTEFPLFGCKYDFQLDGVVDCPEFLVHFGVLEKLAAKYGMVPVYKENFAKMYEMKIKDPKKRDLLKRMSALEEYPPPKGKSLVSPLPISYLAAERRIEELKDERSDITNVLTISKEEWDAITLYLAFAFQKVLPPDESVDDIVSAPEPNRKRKLEDDDGDDLGS